MNTHLVEELARVRLDEARAEAVRRAVVRSLRPARQPMRVRAGLALIKAGRWLAHGAPRRAVQPRRVTA